MALQAIDIDIGGTYIQPAIFSEDGEIQPIETLPTADCEDPQVHLDRLVERTGRLAHDKKITGIGLVAAPGFLSKRSLAKGFNPDRPKNLTAVIKLNL